MATFKLYQKTTQTDKEKLIPVFMRFISGKEHDYRVDTGFKFKVDNWSNETETIKQRAGLKEKDEQKKKLTNFKRKIEDLIHNLNSLNFSKEYLIEYIDKFHNPDKYVEVKETLFSFIDRYIKESEKRINPDSGKYIAESTKKKYKTCFNYLKSYAKTKYPGFDFDNENVDLNLFKKINFDNIDLDFYDDFVNYLTHDKDLSKNTIGKQIAVLKGFLNEATEKDINSNMSYKSKRFSIITEESEAVYLNDDELNKIFLKDFSDKPHLERVRDLFLIGAYTGCRFGDFTIITPDKIKNNMISIEQEKTGNKVVIPLHPIVKFILKKYDGALPPAIKNQPFNRAIKEVCEIAEINDIETKNITKGGIRKTIMEKKCKLVSSHTARRSFATNLYKSGFPAISIMKITGHKSEKSFLKYIKVTPEEHAVLLQKFWDENYKHLKVV